MFAIGDEAWPGISKLIEEAGEVQQVCGKLIGARGAHEHWDGTNLKDRLESELGDLYAALDFVAAHNNLDFVAIMEQRHKKIDLFDEWQADGEAKHVADLQGLAAKVTSRNRSGSSQERDRKDTRDDLNQPLRAKITEDGDGR